MNAASITASIELPRIGESRQLLSYTALVIIWCTLGLGLGLGLFF